MLLSHSCHSAQLPKASTSRSVPCSFGDEIHYFLPIHSWSAVYQACARPGDTVRTLTQNQAAARMGLSAGGKTTTNNQRSCSRDGQDAEAQDFFPDARASLSRDRNALTLSVK